MGHESPNPATVRRLFLILTAAAVIRLGWVLFTPALPTSDFGTYDNIAHRLADGLAYPNSYRVPGYPYFLAALYTLFGDNLLVPKLANVVLGTLTCLFTFLIAQRSFGDRVALVASGIVALLPSLTLYAGLLASENLFTCLLLASGALFLSGLERERIQWSLLVGSGLLLGLATLVRPLSLFLPGAWLLYLLWRRWSIKRSVLTIAVVSVATIMTVLPWTIRNASIARRFVGLSTNGGITFLIGFNERANGHYVGEVRTEFRREAEELGLDEFERNDLAYERAFEFIRDHPVRVVALIPLKWYHLFRDDVSGVVWNFEVTSRQPPQELRHFLIIITQGYYLALMVLAVAGVLFLREPHIEHRRYGFPLSFIIYWLAFHAALFGDDRFHLPILPLLAMFSAFGLVSLIDTLKTQRGWRSTAAKLETAKPRSIEGNTCSRF